MNEGPWDWTVAPEDGGRLTRLTWRGHELLTAPPEAFRPPTGDFGAYETRPVYGYDDCLPTVDACADLPDHGEVCWLPAKATNVGGDLRAATTTGRGRRPEVASHTQGTARPRLSETLCRRRPLLFRRRLEPDGDALHWHFTVGNMGAAPVHFLHVMHPLMPGEQFAGIDLPPCDVAVDEQTGAPVAEPLAALGPEAARMLLLRGVREGLFTIHRADGIRLTVTYPVELFPTLGIWWNPGAYPPEAGCRRREFAVEPIPGPWSSLTRSLAEGGALVAPAHATLTWTITWRMSTDATCA